MATVTTCSELLPATSVATTVKLCDSALSKSALKSALVVTSPETALMLKPKLSSARLNEKPSLVSASSEAVAV